MPTYDYRCEANGQLVEVKHGMNELLTTWGELCEQAGVEPGETPPETPVKRLITGGQIISSSRLGDAPAPSCGAGPCCAGGMCGME